jgi:DnaK suppressor protein
LLDAAKYATYARPQRRLSSPIQENIDRITAEFGRHEGDVGETKRLAALMQAQRNEVFFDSVKKNAWEKQNARPTKKRDKMTPTDTQRFASFLEARQKELSGSMRNRDDIVIEKASDTLDEVQLMTERELAIRNLDRNSVALRQIRRALFRIGNGTYGVCLHCEDDISPKRIAAVPWAAFCIKCQEQIDLREIEVDETFGLASAD